MLELFDVEQPSGVSKIANVVSRELQQRGHQVIQLRAGRDAPERDVFSETACNGSGLRNHTAVVRRLRRIILERDIQIVHAHHRRLALLALMATRGTNARVVEHAHSVFTDKRWTSFRSHAVVALTPSLAAELEDRYRHAKGRLHVCPNGVEVERVDREVGGTPLLLLAVGRVEEAKDPRSFGQLVAELASRNVQARGVWLGDGPMLVEMRKEFEGIVDFPGSVPSTKTWIRRADCVVSSSRREGLPLALMEGMAMARPILARDAGGVAELISNGEGLLWGPNESSASFAERAAEFLSDTKKMRSAGEAAWATVARDYSVERMMNSIIEIFERTVVL